MAERLQGKVLWLSILVRTIIFMIVALGGLAFVSPNNQLMLVVLFLLSLLTSRAGGHLFVKFYKNKKKDI